MSTRHEDRRLSDMLLELLGAHGLVRLAERHGGCRLYVPTGAPDALARELGTKVARLLADRYAGSYLRVPLARELRARHYRAAGATNAQIARRLGMSETGVDRLFHEMPNKPVKGSGDPRQLKLI